MICGFILQFTVDIYSWKYSDDLIDYLALKIVLLAVITEL